MNRPFPMNNILRIHTSKWTGYLEIESGRIEVAFLIVYFENSVYPT